MFAGRDIGNRSKVWGREFRAIVSVGFGSGSLCVLVWRVVAAVGPVMAPGRLSLGCSAQVF